MYINQFFIAGVNYKKTEASVRGKFAINQEQYAALLKKAGEDGISEVFVLSTCNRTEIYGLANTAENLTALLCSQTVGSLDTFKELAYIKKGADAIEHLFQVAAGLDSQILGDYEIVGQIRAASKFAKARGFIGTFTEKLLNCVLQCSKEIKNKTRLSGGTVSVSFAAVQFLKRNVLEIKNKKIILIGTGKIGRNTCKNLLDYLDTTNITLINRSNEKAAILAKELNLQYALYADADAEIVLADIVIVSTNADEPIIKKSQLFNSPKKILIDLSIPNNIEPEVIELANITLVNVDDLSKINDTTLAQRQAEVPVANAIIAAHINDLVSWHTMRKNIPVLKAVKQKLTDLHQCNLYLLDQPSPVDKNGYAVQKIVTSMAVKMRTQNQAGCYFIEAINDFISCSN